MADAKIKLLAIERLRMTTDGDGVTTLICGMGCPLRCRFCINPASWDGSFGGKELTKEELYESVKMDSLYYITTGGGLMFGGGEPLLQSEFLKDFMGTYQSSGWNFYLESSLNVPRKNLDDVIPYINEYVIDTKDMDEERYVRYTGGDYKRFFDNLMYLKEQVGEEKIVLRIPTIPFLHESGKEAEENAEKLKKLGFTRFDFLTYVNPGNRKDISETARKNIETLAVRKE
ncbi:MAG: radical SAM protein [Lachnospiraceae bacterium]|nr:radical SAM protein [Lachnospiraceae bacterium]